MSQRRNRLLYDLKTVMVSSGFTPERKNELEKMLCNLGCILADGTDKSVKITHFVACEQDSSQNFTYVVSWVIESHQKGSFLPERDFFITKKRKFSRFPSKTKNVKKIKKTKLPKENPKQILQVSTGVTFQKLIGDTEAIKIKEQEWNQKVFNFSPETESNFQVKVKINDEDLKKRLLEAQRLARKCIVEIFTQEDQDEKESVEFLNKRMEESSKLGNFIDQDLLAIMENLQK